MGVILAVLWWPRRHTSPFRWKWSIPLISIFLGVVCTRYRDTPPIVSSLIQVFFYLTPIIWMPNAVNARVSTWIVNTNPAYHLLELVRGPILGYCPSLLSWCVGIGLGIIGMLVTLIFFGTYKKRIAYWV